MKLQILVLCTTLVLAIAPAHAISLGVINDFGNGTGNWTKGGASIGNQPFVVSDGGPNGAGDAFLSNQSDGVGSSGRQVIFNLSSDWNGDYNAAGVTAVELDMVNFGATGLTMRLAFDGLGGRFATSGRSLPADGQWYHFRFVLGTATSVLGGTDLNATLGGVTALRILHNPIPDWRGEGLVSDVGFDNIAGSSNAVPVSSASFSRIKGLYR